MNKVNEAINFYRHLKPFGVNQLKNLKTNDLAVFSSPRGGSTWLAETLKKLTNATLIWEPLFVYNQYKINYLNPFAYPERNANEIGWNQYIPEKAVYPNATIFFDKLFNKEIINLKLYRYNNLSEIKNSTTFLYKFCFGNNLLPWLVNNYDIKPILLVRHPCAVISSQLNYGAWDWHKKNYQYNYNMPIFKEFYEPYIDTLNNITCIEEKLAAEWALTMITPIKSIHNDLKWVTISYEDMVLNPEKVLQKIKDRYNLHWDNTQIKNIVNKPSFTTNSNSKNSNKLTTWKDDLSPYQTDKILNFVNKLGIDFYSENIEPDYSKIYAQ